MKKFLLILSVFLYFSSYSQGTSDGCMRVVFTAAEAYNQEFEDPVGNDESNWRWWFGDVGNFDGQGWSGGQCLAQGGFAQIGWWNHNNYTVYNHTYGTSGTTNAATVPQTYSLRGAYEGDDCGGSCDGCTGGFFNNDDDYIYDQTVSFGINYRFAPPNLNNSFTRVTTNRGSSDFGGRFEVNYTSPRPTVTTNLPQICAGATTSVTFNLQGSVFGGLYVMVDASDNSVDYNSSNPTAILSINGPKTYRVYTSNGGVRSLCYSTIAITTYPCNSDFNCLSTTMTGGNVNPYSTDGPRAGGLNRQTNFFIGAFPTNSYIVDIDVPANGGYSNSLLEVQYANTTVSASVVALPGTFLNRPANVAYDLWWDNPTSTTNFASNAQLQVCACKTANFGTASVNGSSTTVTICETDPGNILLTHNGSVNSFDEQGYGDELRWFSGSCGGTYLGSGMSLSVPSPTSNTTYYASFYVNGTPCRGVNNFCESVSVNVVNATVPGNVTPITQTICISTAPAPLTLSGQTGAVQSWEYSADGGGTWTTAGPSSTSFSTVAYAALPGTHTFRAVVQNGVCDIATTNEAVLIVNPNPVAATLNASETSICSDSTFTIDANSFQGNLQWQVSITSPTSGFVDILGQNSTTFFDAVTNNTTSNINRWYRVGVSNSPCLTTVYSNIIAIEINPVTVPGTVASPIDSICVGDDPGVLSLTGHTGSITSWVVKYNSGAYTSIVNTNNIYSPGTLNTAGLYEYAAVVKSGGCEYDTSVVHSIEVLPIITVSINGPIEACEGVSVNLTSTTSGGIGTYVYQWRRNGIAVGTNSSTLATSTTLTPGNYNYTLDVTSGPCSQSSIIHQVTVRARPVITNVTSNNLICYGVNIGEINITATADSFSIDNGATYFTSNTFTSLAAGSYTLITKNNFSCETPFGSNPVIITQPDSTSISFNVIEPNCVTSNDGQITVNATGGTPGFEYAIGGGAYQSGNVFTNLAPGTYTLSVRDNNNCVYSKDTTIAAQYTFDMAIDSFKNVSCPGSADGYLQVGTTGGVAPFTFSLDNTSFQTDSVFTNLVAGNYTIYSLDDNGCSDFVTINILESPPVRIDLDSVIEITCNGQTDAAIYVTPSGSTTPYSYTWRLNGVTVSNSQNLVGIGPGSYNLTVSSSSSCEATLSVTITEPAALTASTTSTSNTSCSNTADGGAMVSVTGGTASYTYSWEDAGNTQVSTSQNLSGVGAGTYTLTVTDANMCTTTTTATVTSPVAITAVTVVTPPNCATSNDGSITVNVSGGTAGFTYSLNGGATQNTNVFSNLGAGTYTIDIVDANGCTGIGNAILTNQYTTTLAVQSQTNVSCSGQNDGTVTLVATGAVGTVTYTINGTNPQTTAVFSGLAAGLYNFESVDGNGCSATTSATITENPPMSLSLDSTTNVACNGQNTGAIYVSTTGGATPYSYSVNGGVGQLSGSFTGLGAGSYNVMVTDTSGCTESVSVTITAPSVLTASTTSTSNTSCSNTTDGGAMVSITGGTASYTYSWEDAGNTQVSTSQNLSGVGAGTYTLTVTDANMCTTTTTATVTSPVAITAVTVVTPPNCATSNDGSITVNVSGGTAGFTYSLNGGATQNTNVFSNLGAGTYTIDIVDANGCTGIGNAILTNQYTTTLAVQSQTNVSCSGQNDGTVTLVATGTVGTVTYTINGTNPQTTAVFSGLAAGLYNFESVDGNGCSATTSATITENPPMSLSLDSTTNVACNGQNTGAIYVSTTGGATPYSYSVNGGVGQLSGSFTGLGAGSYNVMVTDTSGCTESVSVTITAPSVLTASTTSTSNTSCSNTTDGGAMVSVTGGTASYTYSWEDAGNTQVSTSQNLSGVGAGTYTLTVTDANMCTTTTTATVTSPIVLGIVINPINPSCANSNDGSIIVNVSGGTSPYTYSINGGALQNTNTFNNLSAGNYSVDVVDANGCTGVGNAILTNQYTTTLAVQSQTNVSCSGQNDGTVTLVATGAVGTVTYTINGTNPQTTAVFSGLAAGLYNFESVDGNGCRATTSATITENPPMSLSLDSTMNVACNGQNTGAIYVSTTGGATPYSYSVNGGVGQLSGSFTGLGAGSYNVMVTDTSGCTESVSVTITAPSVLTASTTSTSNTSCSNTTDGGAMVSVTGGTASYTYSWEDAGNTQVSTSQNLSGVGAGTYTLTVTDANMCTTTTTATVTSPVAITAVTVVTPPNCATSNDGSITVNVSGGTAGFTYSLNGGATQNTNVFSNLGAGTYTIDIVDANGCTGIGNAILTNQYTTTLAVQSQTNVSCSGQNDGTVTLVATGAVGTVTYTINGTNPQTTAVFSGLAAGLYNFESVDGNGCSATTSATITENPPMSLSLDSTTNVACNGQNTGAIYVSTTGGATPYSYSVNGGVGQLSGSFTGLGAGSYNVMVTDNAGCTESVSVTLSSPPALALVLAATSNILCAGDDNGTIDISVGGGTTPYTFSWSDGTSVIGFSEDIDNLPVGAYTLTVTDGNNCTETISQSITSPTPLAGTIAITNEVCFDDNQGTASATASGGTAPYTYLWSTLETTQTIGNLGSGVIAVQISDNNGCTITLTDTIEGPLSALAINLIRLSNVTCFGGNDGEILTSISGGTAPYTITWTPGGMDTEAIDSLTAGVYTMNVVDANGCSTSANYTITQQPQIVSTLSVTNPTCFGQETGMALVGASGGTPPFVYEWNTTPVQNGALANNLAGDTSYIVSITDFNGCVVYDTAEIVYPAPMSITTTEQGVTCSATQNGEVAVVVSGGNAPYTYQVNGFMQTDSVFENLEVGTYVVFVLDNNNCNASAQFDIVQNAALEIDLTGAGNDNNFWSDDVFIVRGEEVDLLVEVQSTGISVDGVSWSATGSIPVDTSACVNPPCLDATIQPIEDMTVLVSVQDTNGCIVQDTLRVNVSQEPVFFMPSAFSPNGDCLNDNFELNVLGATNLNVRIFNRWGEELFHNPDQENGLSTQDEMNAECQSGNINPRNAWDGTFKGEPMPIGAYSYQVDATMFDGEVRTMSGTITILR